jgi:enediyne biosynthesis protein E4
VANDSSSSALYKNNHDGKFIDIALEAGVAYSPDGKPQAGMGVAAADYDCDGLLDIVKTTSPATPPAFITTPGESKSHHCG